MNPSYKMVERDAHGRQFLRVTPLQEYINYSGQTIEKLYRGIDYNIGYTNYNQITNIGCNPGCNINCNCDPYKFHYMQSANYAK